MIVPLQRLETPPEALLGLPQHFEQDVVVLPLDIIEATGIYAVEAEQLPKAFRAAGVNASFLHTDPTTRQWRVLMGESVVQLILAIGLNMLGAGGWDALKAAWLQWWAEHGRPSRLAVDFRVTTTDGESAWFRAEGNGEDVIAAFEEAGRQLRGAPRQDSNG